jgi:hypothetical protein
VGTQQWSLTLAQWGGSWGFTMEQMDEHISKAMEMDEHDSFNHQQMGFDQV